VGGCGSRARLKWWAFVFCVCKGKKGRDLFVFCRDRILQDGGRGRRRGAGGKDRWRKGCVGDEARAFPPWRVVRPKSSRLSLLCARTAQGSSLVVGSPPQGWGGGMESSQPVLGAAAGGGGRDRWARAARRCRRPFKEEK